VRQSGQQAGMPELLCAVALSMTACAGAAQVVAPVVVICAPGSDAQLSLVQRDVEEGERYLQGKNYEGAIRAFRAGVSKLGSNYVDPRTLDDTGQRLALASAEERNGRVSVAAHLLHGALSSRLSLCKRKSVSASSPALAPQDER
jgi:hypothetical protein